MIFTADTGATKTVISDRVYRKIPESERPMLHPTTKLTGACGAPLVELGKALFDFDLEDFKVKHEAIVAEIADEGLLGMDILQSSTNGPADILLSEGRIKFKNSNIEIPCIQIGNPETTRKVRSADDFKVPGSSEAIIDVFIERNEKEDNSEVLIEPSQNFVENSSLMMAPCVVNMRGNVTAPIRVMNPFPTDTIIKQDSILGQASDFTCLQTLVQTERLQESINCHSMRRIGKDSSNTQPEENYPSNKYSDLEGIQIPDHLAELYHNTCKGRTTEEKTRIKQVFIKYQDTFSRDENDIGLTHLSEHTIDTGNARPIKLPPRRVPLAFAEEERKVIKQMEEQGIITKSNSPWASPIVLVRKKNGKIRPCVDYRKLNAVTLNKDAFPIPRTRDCLDAVAGAKYFSTFDLTAGYHQVPVKKEDIPKTAFVTKYGLYAFSRMPFGLTGSPATFQRVMELALSGLQWLTCLIYLDDVIVFGSSFEQHMERIEQVLLRMKEAGLKLKPQKCQILQEEVTFLGHIVSKEGVKPNSDNIAKIALWPEPKDVTGVRQILGMASYYRRFIKGYSEIAKPLTNLTRKSIPFYWSEECKESFNLIKTILTKSPIMAYPLDHGNYILDTDASDVAIGAVLSQVQNGTERVIAYGSRTLNKAEKNYCVTDKELLALRYFIEYYRQYLLGRNFKVRTDHQALKWLFSLKEPKGRIARWLEILSAYNFTVEYRPGKKHANADTMSRGAHPRDCECTLEDDMEALRCGPCKKCKKRAAEMDSSLRDWIIVPDPPGEKDTIVRKVQTRSRETDYNNTELWVPWTKRYTLRELKQLQEEDSYIKPIMEAVKKK